MTKKNKKNYIKFLEPFYIIYIGVTFGLMVMYLFLVLDDDIQWFNPQDLFTQWIAVFYPAVVIIVIKVIKEIYMEIKGKIETEKIKTDNILKISVIAGIVVVVFSLVYYFVFLPAKKQNNMKKCNEEVEELVGWNSSSKYKMVKFEREYDRCLRRKGL